MPAILELMSVFNKQGCRIQDQYTRTNVHGFICNSQKLETTQMSITRCKHLNKNCGTSIQCNITQQLKGEKNETINHLCVLPVEK